MRQNDFLAIWYFYNFGDKNWFLLEVQDFGNILKFAVFNYNGARDFSYHIILLVIKSLLPSSNYDIDYVGGHRLVPHQVKLVRFSFNTKCTCIVCYGRSNFYTFLIRLMTHKVLNQLPCEKKVNRQLACLS